MHDLLPWVDWQTIAIVSVVVMGWCCFLDQRGGRS